MVELSRPTDDSREILHAAGYALQRGYLYQKGGVIWSTWSTPAGNSSRYSKRLKATPTGSAARS